MHPTIRPFKPLVIGAPRTGHALLCSVVIWFCKLFPKKEDASLKQAVINVFIENTQGIISNAVINIFRAAGLENDLMYNGNFRDLVGGPKWLKAEDVSRACFRKYIGVRGMGDFTLITSHPREVLDFNEVLHSHTAPALWPNLICYDECVRYASMRNPIGTLNSACFSINAIASEYIQKYLHCENDSEDFRVPLALFKLTDMDTISSIVTFYKSYFDEYLGVRGEYAEMRWEDLITNPIQTIQFLAKAGRLDVSESFARSLWDRIGFKNLTGSHMHNFRASRAKVGDWKNSIVNQHIDLLRQHGFDKIMRELGYGPLEDLDPDSYTPFQHQVSTLIDRGEVFRDYPDQDLFGFAFQKSNIRWENLPGFRGYNWAEWSRIERSCFADQELEVTVWGTVEEILLEYNALLTDLINCRWGNPQSAIRGLDAVFQKHKACARFGEEQYISAFRAAVAAIQTFFATIHLPHLQVVD